MKLKRHIAIVMSFLLVAVSFAGITFAEDKNVTIELRDGYTGEILRYHEDYIDTVSFSVYNSSGGEIAISPITHDTPDVIYIDGFSASLTIGKAYDIKAASPGHYMTNEHFIVDETGDRTSAHLYKKADITMVPSSAIKADVRECGESGVDTRIIRENLPEGFNPDEFFVILIPGTTWDVENDGMPAGIEQAGQEPMDKSRGENAPPGNYILFVGFRTIGGHGVLTGYTSMPVEITEAKPGGSGDPGGPGGGITGDLLFEFTATDPEAPELDGALIEFNTNTDEFIVPCPENIKSIKFPDTFDGRTMTFSMINDEWYQDAVRGSLNPDELAIYDSISIENNEMAFNFPFKRITVECTLEGEERPWPYSFTFYQPGYEYMELSFAFEGIGLNSEIVEETYTAEVNREAASSWGNQRRIEIPADISSAAVDVTAILPELDNEPIAWIGGGVWEYLVDRSDLAKMKDGKLELNRYFGKVAIHYQYLIGYSWESALINFYEPDFMGIDVIPEIGVGEWHTGITNVSGYSAALRPTAYVYFINDTVDIVPSEEGKEYTISDITPEDPDVSINYNEHTNRWTIALPHISKPVTTLMLTLNVESEPDRVVPLDIKRVMMNAESRDFKDREPGDEVGFLYDQTSFIYQGYEEFATCVYVFSEQDENPVFLIDHTLLVMYYENDRILGSKQFPVQLPKVAEDGSGDIIDRDTVIVYIEGNPDYADVAGANRIAVFVVDKEGISSSDATFGGATFGIGAGWGHLMPNHEDWGSGKDGMDYE